MEWVEAFYTKQSTWLADDYFGEVQDQHRTRAATIVRLAGPPPQHVLELGAGGGQDAAAMADLGFEVVAVEILPRAADHARCLALRQHLGTLSVMQGNFYEVDPDGPFDIVCYWDGFGIGSDTDQRHLLRRISAWLRPNGQALIEVYTPWYWARAAGRTMTFGDIVRRYDFDAAGSRMRDRWWWEADPSSAVEQSLRCYAPTDLVLLLEETGLTLAGVEPGGMVDEATGQFIAMVPLPQAMSYLATLRRET